MTAPIPDEAVEAAARAMAICEQYDGCFERLDGTDPDGEEPTDSDEEDAEWWRMRARAALTAAAPHIADERAADAELDRDHARVAGQAFRKKYNDLRVGIEALRDEMPMLTSDLCPHEPDEHAEGCCDVCDLAFAIDSEVRDRLDALLREGAR